MADTFDLRLMRRGMKPRDLDRIHIPPDTKECLGEIAVGVFTSASNAGNTFQEALLAVYLTGLQNARAALEEKHG